MLRSRCETLYYIWTSGLLLHPTLTQSQAVCHLLWHYQLLTFVAGDSRVSLLVFSTHAGCCLLPAPPPPSPPLRNSFRTRFALICGVALSLQCMQVRCCASLLTLLFRNTDAPISHKHLELELFVNPNFVGTWNLFLTMNCKFNPRRNIKDTLLATPCSVHWQ